MKLTMTNAIVLHETGGPEKLLWETAEVLSPEPNQVAIRHTAVGVNYIDTYMRSGLYPIDLPGVIGQQGVGVVTALGAGVGRFAVGDRVTYGMAPGGAYIEERVIGTDVLVPLPKGISDELAAATLLRGMTAEYLLFRLYAVQPGDTVIVHAATGATGVILCQWARVLGARVIGTVGSGSRFERARAAGCELVLEYQDPDFVEKVGDFTDGRLCEVVYDSVGRDTFATSRKCVARRGMLVTFGNASGKPEPLDVLDLASQGSIFVTRPRLDHYAATVEETEGSAARFFAAVASGTVDPRSTQSFPLREAAAAHRHLEDREQLTTPVLVPDR
ncbi:MAG TPA: quinone oxidoreductase [Gammaproteobacteria bacterium]|jgi:NADPH2:quinone reductase|nr:quinone oxidoreductase [Gammaproteobacteria bacterium]